MESLVDGNCMIIPMAHQSSSITCDEEIWNEIQDYKKALVNMFKSNGSDCVFFEQYNSDKRLGHMIIECMPLEYDVSNMAPIYFKVSCSSVRCFHFKFLVLTSILCLLESHNGERKRMGSE